MLMITKNILEKWFPKTKVIIKLDLNLCLLSIIKLVFIFEDA